MRGVSVECVRAVIRVVHRIVRMTATVTPASATNPKLERVCENEMSETDSPVETPMAGDVVCLTRTHTGVVKRWFGILHVLGVPLYGDSRTFEILARAQKKPEAG